MKLRSVCSLLVFSGGVWAAEPLKIELVEPRLTSIREEMNKSDVLSSLRQAAVLTAQLVSCNGAAAGPDDSRIQECSKTVEVQGTAKDALVQILSADAKFEDYGIPCQCEFEPQLRLRWKSAESTTTFVVLVSAVSHGEIRAYRDGAKVCEIKDGAFIPAFLDFLDRVFPQHKTSVGLRKLHEEVRLKEKAEPPPAPRSKAAIPASGAHASP
jgi:hypothetical protein